MEQRVQRVRELQVVGRVRVASRLCLLVCADPFFSRYFTGNRPDPRFPKGSGISEACWAFGSPTRRYDQLPVRGPVRRWPGPTPRGPPMADGSGRLNEDIVDVQEESKEGWCGFEGVVDVQRFR